MTREAPRTAWKPGQSGNMNGRPKKYLGMTTADIYRVGNLRKFGLTIEQYEEIHTRQGGVCAICGEPEVKTQAVIKNGVKRASRLSVDHDHKTGKVRGLLCYRCNTGIGKLRDDPDLLRKAARYIGYVVEE